MTTVDSRPGFRWLYRRAISLLLAAVVALALVGATFFSAPHSTLAATATTTANLNLRAGPSTSQQVLMVMPAGSAVTVTGAAQNGFYPVSYKGTNGWAYGAYLSGVGGSGSSSGTAVTTDSLNLRSGPSLNDSVLLVMPRGATVTLTGNSQNGFLPVSYNGRTGWAYSDYLSTGGSGSGSSSGSGSAPSGSTWVTTDSLNLRKGPSTSDPVLVVMPAGSTVTVTGAAQNGFYPVDYKGTSGWAYGAYLSQGGQGSTQTGSTGSSGSYTTQQIIDIIYAAADRYGQSRDDMLRVAKCESNLDPRAVSPDEAYGLFQFLRSTWATTPYASSDIFDPTANANAAGWMWSVGRRGEWSCQ